MPDRILLSTNQRNFAECLALARQYQIGLEIQTFAYPKVLSGDWRELLGQVQKDLIGFSGERALHGPFIDMAAGSPDPLIREVVRQRILTALETAASLNAINVVFHANFIASMRNAGYRSEFQANQVEFWPPLAERAAELGLVIVLENMWEFDPSIIASIVEAIKMPSLRACLDVGHARLFADPEFPIERWIATLGPYIAHVHMNNNPGTVDEHHGLDEGVINYQAVLPLLRALPSQPVFSLEMTDARDMERSLRYLQLPEPFPSRD